MHRVAGTAVAVSALLLGAACAAPAVTERATTTRTAVLDRPVRGTPSATPSPTPSATPSATPDVTPSGTPDATPSPTPDEPSPQPPGDPSDEPLPPGGDPACPASSGLPHTRAPGAGRTVALTFDDGPGPATGPVLDALRRYGVPATFFVIGERVAADPSTVRREAAAGHLVGDHSWDHRYPSEVAWTDRWLQQQLHRTADAVSAITGRPTCWFRPPGGFLTNVQHAAQSQRLRVALWSIDPRDWRTDQSQVAYTVAAQGIFQRATAIGDDLHPVVLLHDGGGGRGATAAALPRIIDWYRAHGYRFVRLDGR